MSDRKFGCGDRVRHTRRPEWGVGSVVKVEEISQNGRAAQRLAVRFPNGGLKTLSTAHAEIELVAAEGGEPAPGQSAVADWQQLTEGDWLAPLARRRVGETMVALTAEARDPFNSMRQRLLVTLDLYRFGRSGRTLIDWAIAQSGLDDPLSHFTRHELEVLFDQWAAARDDHLHKLLGQARQEHQMLKELLASAPPAARDAVRRITDQR